MENNKKNIDIIELMETPIEQIQLSTQKLTTRTHNALKRRSIYNIRDLIFWKNERRDFKDIDNLGNKCNEDLKQELIGYGINIEDRNQCISLMNEFIEKKQKTIVDIPKILNAKLEHESYRIPFFELDSNNYNTFYDIIKEDKKKLSEMLDDELGVYGEWNYFRLKFTFIKYNIDIDNEEQCNYLVEQYEKETKNISKNKKLNQVTNDNDSLEKELTRKQKVLKKLKEQLERRKQLEQQLAECDKEYSELIKQYNSLNSKESSNDHGTK